MSAHRLVALLLVLAASGAPLAQADETAALSARIDLLARPETAAKLASYARNLYEALLARGFGQEQAMQMSVALASTATAAGECGGAVD